MEQKLCVLIDFENIAAGAEKEGHGRFDIRAVMRRLKDKGRILVSRAYGDWGRFAKFKQGLLQEGVNMMELTSYRGQEKNRADIALVVDAMELAYTRDYIDTFVLLSGDSDFTPLVARLKELNKRVIGLGTRGSTSRLLAESCDEFIFYESLKKRGEDRSGRPSRGPRAERSAPAGRAPAPAREPNRDTSDAQADTSDAQADTSDAQADTPPSLTRDDAFALLVETMEGIQKDQPGKVLAGLVKQSIQRKEPAFDEADFGYAGFARFLEAARDKGLVVLNRDEKAGGYRVDVPAEGATPAAGAPAPEAEEPEADLLPELDGEAGQMREVLTKEGVNPLTRMLRHTVVHEFVDHVQERTARKKRNTLMYVHGDIARRCRKTDPYVPAHYVRTVINALKLAGELKHSDGNPVRSPSAPFTINKDAEEMLESLDHFYLETLLDRNVPLDNGEALSLLLWGDQAHAKEASQLAAWVIHDRGTPAHAEEPAPAGEPAPAEE